MAQYRNDIQRNFEYFCRERDDIEKRYGRNIYVVIENAGIASVGTNESTLAEEYRSRNVLIISAAESRRADDYDLPFTD